MICLNVFGDSVIQTLKLDKHKNWPLSHVEAAKLADLSLPVLKHDQKRFIRIPEMRPLGTFWSIFSNGCHGNDDR